jgi:hypothetical protein
MSREGDCTRADELFVELEQGASLSEAHTLWLATHLDGCVRCSGESDAMSLQIAAALRSPQLLRQPADDAFFAAQQAAIMAAVRSSPAPRRVARLTRIRRSAPYVVGLALAAGFALVVIVPRLGVHEAEQVAQLDESTERTARVDAPAVVPPGQSTADDPREVAAEAADDDGTWLLAANDPFPASVDLSLGSLSDADLDELETMFAEEG